MASAASYFGVPIMVSTPTGDFWISFNKPNREYKYPSMANVGATIIPESYTEALEDFFIFTPQRVNLQCMMSLNTCCIVDSLEAFERCGYIVDWPDGLKDIIAAEMKAQDEAFARIVPDPPSNNGQIVY